MATITVTTFDDELDAGAIEGADLSLREALELARASEGADVIVFADSLGAGTVLLNPALEGRGGNLFIDTDVTIDGGGDVTIDGRDQTRIFYIDEGAETTLRGLTLQNGRAQGTNGGDGFGSGSGGGGGLGAGGAVFVAGGATVRIDDVTFGGSEADGNGASVQQEEAGHALGVWAKVGPDQGHALGQARADRLDPERCGGGAFVRRGPHLQSGGHQHLPRPGAQPVGGNQVQRALGEKAGPGGGTEQGPGGHLRVPLPAQPPGTRIQHAPAGARPRLGLSEPAAKRGHVRPVGLDARLSRQGGDARGQHGRNQRRGRPCVGLREKGVAVRVITPAVGSDRRHGPLRQA